MVCIITMLHRKYSCNKRCTGYFRNILCLRCFLDVSFDFTENNEIWCKDAGKGTIAYDSKTLAMSNCKSSESCTTVVVDECSDDKNYKYYLCNGLKFERAGGNWKCHKSWRKKCRSKSKT